MIDTKVMVFVNKKSEGSSYLYLDAFQVVSMFWAKNTGENVVIRLTSGDKFTAEMNLEEFSALVEKVDRIKQMR